MVTILQRHHREERAKRRSNPAIWPIFFHSVSTTDGVDLEEKHKEGKYDPPLPKDASENHIRALDKAQLVETLRVPWHLQCQQIPAGGELQRQFSSSGKLWR